MTVSLADGLREYLARDWEAVRESKERYWSEELSAAERIRLAESLRPSAIATSRGWPSDADRDEDLESHVRLARALRRAGPAGPG